MKKFFLVLFLCLLPFDFFSQSIGEYTLVHIPSGKIFNIYDSAELFFDYVNENIDLSKIQLTNNGGNIKSGLETYKGKFWEITVQRIEYKMKEGEKNWMLLNGAQHPETDFNVLSLKVSKDFMTVRGVKIGDDLKTIMEKYPEIKGYKKVLQDFDNEELKENLIDLLGTTNSVSKVKCFILKEHFFRLERGEVSKPSFHYFLVFNLDKKQKISEIKIIIIPDGM